MRQMLEAAWHETAAQAGLAASNAEAVFQDLCRRYSEPTRAYHTLDHISAMLDIIAGFGSGLHDPVAVRFAVWFHDAVYDPRRSDNEEESAALAASALSPDRALPPLRPAVQRLILATKTHHCSPDDTDCQALLDADLAILGSSVSDYDRYAQAIRKEYAWVPEAEYRVGRRKVLEGFLGRERLYYTTSLFEAREEAARSNLGREIEHLADPAKP